MRRLLVISVLMMAVACKHSPTACNCPTPTPSPTATPTATPTPTPTNHPPTLGIRVTPNPITGPAPLYVLVAMCLCQDADADPMHFIFHWGDIPHHDQHSDFCRWDHTYTTPGDYDAWFCVTDAKSDPVCKNYVVHVT
jgi:hypothetical protein